MKLALANAINVTAMPKAEGQHKGAREEQSVVKPHESSELFYNKTNYSSRFHSVVLKSER